VLLGRGPRRSSSVKSGTKLNLAWARRLSASSPRRRVCDHGSRCRDRCGTSGIARDPARRMAGRAPQLPRDVARTARSALSPAREGVASILVGPEADTASFRAVTRRYYLSRSQARTIGSSTRRMRGPLGLAEPQGSDRSDYNHFADGSRRMNPSGGPPIVLVVEDDASLQRALGGLLQRKGFTPVEAATVEGAIRGAEAHPVNAVILDLLLAGNGSGVDFLSWLRQQSRYERTPVLIYTGRQMIEHDAEELILRYRAHVFYKPHPVSLLVDYLRRLIPDPSESR
jgi:CheY-like chemotaxis protein